MIMDLIAIINPLLALVSFGTGFLGGYLFHAFIDKHKESSNSGMVLVVVTLVWAMSVIVDILSPQYETSPLLHGLMGAIVGFYYKNNIPKYDNTPSENKT